jgi:hypothetical protein
MSLAGNIAPVVGGVLFCAVAYVSVRTAHRKDRDVAPMPARKTEPAE